VSDTLTRIAEKVNREAGQALAEFALILGLICLVCIVALGLLGTAITQPFTDFIDQAGFGGS
jgi:Flp pilus assembly pilin Flp